MKERLEHIDIIKGIAIFMVVLGHQASLFQLKEISNWVNSFHLPLFMFAGGYMSIKTTKPNLIHLKFWLTFVVKKIKSLIVPYAVWSLFLYSFLKGNFNIDILNNLKIYFVNPPGTVLWFLHTYFFMLVVFSLYYIASVKANKKQKIIYDILILIVTFLMCVCLVMYFKPIPKNLIVFFPYFFLGVLIGKYKFIKVLIEKDSIYTVLFLLFMSSSLIYNNFAINRLNTVVKIIAGISGALFFYVFSQKFQFRSLFRNGLVLFGQKSLVIYIVHFTLLIHAEHAFVDYMTNTYFIFYLFLLVCVTFIISFGCVQIGKIIEQFPYLDFCLFGKKINRYKKQCNKPTK